jgi:hypothetical protein
MPRVAFPVLVLAAAACSHSGAYVMVPATPGTQTQRTQAAGRAPNTSDGSPLSCSQSWRLEDVTDPAVQILVSCASDVRREHVQGGAMARSLDPALAAAHDSVCACAKRLPLPSSVGLQITSVPEEGRARVATTQDDAETPEAASEVAAFTRCVGAFETSFAPFAGRACPEGKTTYIYVFEVELAPSSSQ